MDERAMFDNMSVEELASHWLATDNLKYAIAISDKIAHHDGATKVINHRKEVKYHTACPKCGFGIELDSVSIK